MRVRDCALAMVAWWLALACGDDAAKNPSGNHPSAGQGSGGASASGGSANGGTSTDGGSGAIATGGDGNAAGTGGAGATAGTGGADNTAGAGGAGASGGESDGGQAGEAVGGEGAGASGGSGGSGGGGPVSCEPGATVVITNDAELQAFAALGCVVLDGSLTVNSPTLTSLSALGQPGVLRTISGSLVIENNSLLENLGGLESLRLVGSDSASDALVISGNSRLTNVAALAGITGLLTSVTVVGNPELTSLPIDGLQMTSNVTIANNILLRDITGFTELDDASNITVAANPGLLALSFPGLLSVGSFGVTSNVALVSVAIPRLATADTLTFAGNQALTTIGTLNALTDVDMLVIAGNPSLPQCFVDALDLRLQACNMSCAGNDMTAACN